MKIVIKTPQQLEEERTELIKKMVALLHKQSRSNERYAMRIQWHLNRIMELNHR